MRTLSTFGKATALALLASSLVVTGCASKKPKNNTTSNVMVSPIGNYGQGGYTGGSLVNNSQAVKNAAAGIGDTVYFAYNSDAISNSAAAILKQHAALLAANQGAKVLVAGHTDERGSREYNMSLGERRAAAVRAFLAQSGASDAAVEIISYGEEQPAVEGSGEAAWSKNRRATLSY